MNYNKNKYSLKSSVSRGNYEVLKPHFQWTHRDYGSCIGTEQAQDRAVPSAVTQAPSPKDTGS